MRQLWFSTDCSTNPERYGLALAQWLSEQLAANGYPDGEPPIAEDWGWVVMLQRQPFMLWVGCANQEQHYQCWGVFAVAELGLLQRLRFWHSTSIQQHTAVSILEQQLETLICGAGFTQLEWENHY